MADASCAFQLPAGGLVYVSDRVGEHDFAVLRRLVLPDGSGEAVTGGWSGWRCAATWGSTLLRRMQAAAALQCLDLTPARCPSHPPNPPYPCPSAALLPAGPPHC